MTTKELFKTSEDVLTHIKEDTDPAHELESEVKGYVRNFPITVTRAKGSYLYDNDVQYLDFLAGAGALNYGHNNDLFKDAIIKYIQSDGIIHGLDLMTTAKGQFLDVFSKEILAKRDLSYKVQFCGPTGTNAVEAAIKLARKVKKRVNIISFTNGYHGMTSGALAVTGNYYHKKDIPGTWSQYTTFMPYCNYSDNVDNSIEYIRQYLTDNSSGVNLPAAIILECVQGEGGVNIASPKWLQGIRKLCDEFDIMLIVDDIQMGCGRTGDFFSFEESGIKPDIVVLSKSIGAYGLPMALVLIKPEYDQWTPGQHNGTFRGHNLAFVAATEAINHYWKTTAFSDSIKEKAKLIGARFNAIKERYLDQKFDVRGRGLTWALESVTNPDIAAEVQSECFKHGLIIETCGSKGQSLKPLPALTISEADLNKGLDIIEAAYAHILG